MPGFLEMHAPHGCDRAGRPCIQRALVHVVENRDEMQDEARLLVVARRADLEAGGDFIELGEPVLGVDDGRNETPGAPDRADGAEKPVGDLDALLPGAHCLLGLDLERLAEVVGTGRRRRRGHLGNVDLARDVLGAEPIIVVVRRLQPAPHLFAKIPVDLVGIGGLEVEVDQHADVDPVGGWRCSTNCHRPSPCKGCRSPDDPAMETAQERAVALCSPF